MRQTSWSSQEQSQFLSYLSTSVHQHTLFSQHEPHESDSPIFRIPSPNICSVLEYRYTYDISFAQAKTSSSLDIVVSSALKNSSSIFVDGTAVADKFSQILQSDPNFTPSTNSTTYNFMIYNAMSVAPQYGFRPEEGAPITMSAISNSKRFAFLDVGANPFFLGDSARSTPGEILMSLSRNPPAYAAKLHSMAVHLFTPPASHKMLRYPHQTNLAFQLNLVDVSAVIGRIPGIGGDSQGNAPLGRSFRSSNFVETLLSIFQGPVIRKKNVSISVTTIDMMQEAVIAMAVSRALSMKGLQLIINSEQLLGDIASNLSNIYSIDSRSIVHIPLYLFSFADDSRVAHFEDGDEVRAKVVEKKAVFLIENRLRDRIDDFSSTTSEAIKEVLEIMCGLSRESASLMNAKRMTVPIILQDIANRNVLGQELDWSESIATSKAVEVINFEGLDSRLIPHEKGSALVGSRKKVKESLNQLYLTWDKAVAYFTVDGIVSASKKLRRKSKELANKLHEEICNQPLPEEILLKAEAEIEDDSSLVVGVKPYRSFVVWTVLPMLFGILFGMFLHHKTVRRGRKRGPYLDDITASTVRGLDGVSTQWFSTLSINKPKRI